MGKQIQFYMTEVDENRFLNFLNSDRNVGVFKSVMQTGEITFLDKLPSKDERFWFSICLWDMDNCTPPILEYVPKQDYYVIDEDKSEVIQFSRSHLESTKFGTGRLWAEMLPWNSEYNEEISEKSIAFQKWFERARNWIRRNTEYTKNGIHVLPGAAEFFNTPIKP